MGNVNKNIYHSIYIVMFVYKHTNKYKKVLIIGYIDWVIDYR